MTRILFTGYAPVHFACFRPLYERFRLLPDTEVLVSGGLRSTDESGAARHDTAALYESFDLPPEVVVDASRLPDLDVDILVCASTQSPRPRSYGQAVQIFHGTSFRNRAIRSQNSTYDHYLMLGPYMRRSFERRGVMPADDPRVVEIGFPKTDPLVTGELNRAEVLRELNLSGERPVVLFAPTGAHGNAMEMFGEELLAQFARSNDYDLLVKPHDHAKATINWFDRLSELETDHARLVRSFDVIPALSVTDLLISDASSIANEYLLLDRPIVFLDVPVLLAAAAEEDDRLDLDTWGRKGGVVVRNVTAAMQAVADGLADPTAQSEIRTTIARDLFYNPGTATDAAVEWFRQHTPVSA